ncbi:MAG: protein kinase [Candidatus Aminicenantes bacterium]|jgi:serine/threonine protein kinase/Flp pilus assembly protein TadD
MGIECPKCHSVNPDNSRFCNKCATPLPPSKDISSIPTGTRETPVDDIIRGETFAARYEVIEKLGEGGMGTIYRVEDKKIKEEVALKIIRPEIAADRRTIERFSNELKIARKIVHKNVGRMYDLNEEEGTHFITMEYVPGKDLKSLIRMTKQMSVGTTVHIAEQICEGLAEAHRMGSMHRDLKPNNIILDKQGTARIMDFGVARSLKIRGVKGSGGIIGTPEYMSPEQAETNDIDHRSDIYSLGVILYEMVTGQVPFHGDTPDRIAAKHKTEMVPEPRTFNAQIPAALNRVILKCLEKNKEKRYQKAEDILSDLKKIEEIIPSSEKAFPERKLLTSTTRFTQVLRKRWGFIAAFLLVVVAWFVFQHIRNLEPRLPSAEGPVLVVLPFRNLGPPGDEYFADGITEEITGRLAAIHGLSVISRTSALQYKNTEKMTKTIGEELRVDYVLEGTVRWEKTLEGKGRVRVTPQLIRVSDDTHIWTQRYDQDFEDIFSVQSEIAEQVARQLDLTLLEPERRALFARPTDNLEAYDQYLRAGEVESRGWLHWDIREIEQAIEMYEKATELDPDFTLAYIALSKTESFMYISGMDHTEERLARSKDSVDRALALEPDLPEAREALAFYYYRGFLDYERATDILESIRRARPNYKLSLLGYIQRRQGRWEESLETLEREFRGNPRDSDLAHQIGLSYMCMRRYEEAEEWFNRAIMIDPEKLYSHLARARIPFLAEGNIQETQALLGTFPHSQITEVTRFDLGMAERKFQEVLERLDFLPFDSFEEDFNYFHKNLAYAILYHAMNELVLVRSNAESAQVALEQLIEERSGDAKLYGALGLAYAYLGESHEAIREGTRAVELYPVSRDAFGGPRYILNLAEIYTVTGLYEEAINLLEFLMSVPAGNSISVPVLRLDPRWDPLRGHPRFQSLVQ